MKKSQPVQLRFTAKRQDASQSIAAGIYTSINTERAKELNSYLESGSQAEIVSATIDPMDYQNAYTFSQDYLCVELMRKFPCWDIGIDRAEVALESFRRTESRLTRCGWFENIRFSLGSSTLTNSSLILLVQRKIADVLGPFHLDEVIDRCTFGPGASTSIRRSKASLVNKFGEQPQLSYNATELARAYSMFVPRWDFTPTVVAGSRVVTVPKNAKTDRCICIEPDLNMYFQKGLGAVIRSRLNRRGLLLPNAQEINAELSKIGSANGQLATVDLSEASDSIHMDLVRWLLPPDWVTYIEQCRSPYAVLPNGEKLLLRKVSSMGNGFTFELETLIFWAFTQVLEQYFIGGSGRDTVTCFGDDIICSSKLVPVLIDVFAHYNFLVNPRKSFWTGPFRESCGKHFFNGSDVTPFYVKAPIDTIMRLYWAYNSVVRWSRLPFGRDATLRPVAELVESLIPKERRFGIPEGYGDVGLISDWDEVAPARKSKGQLQGWTTTAAVPVVRKDDRDGVMSSFAKLHLMDLSSGSRDGILRPDVEHLQTARPSTVGYRVGRLFVDQWQHLGPWLD